MSEKIRMYHIENDLLRVTVSEYGAEVCGITSKEDGTAFLKCPGGAFWKSTSPILFPINGRLWENKMTVSGTEYEMGCHGFARKSPFTLVSASSDRIRFSLSDSEETYRMNYPYHFTLEVEYFLSGHALCTTVTVKNTDTKDLPFTVGFHPGFQVPVGGIGDFSDCYLEFDREVQPETWVMSERCFLTHDAPVAYPLKENKILPLRHTLFDNDAVFLMGTGDAVTLKSGKSNHTVRVEYPGFPYLGVWHTPKTEANFVCIEPWNGCPDYDGESGDFLKKRDLFRLSPGAEQSFHMNIICK